MTTDLSTRQGLSGTRLCVRVWSGLAESAVGRDVRFNTRGGVPTDLVFGTRSGRHGVVGLSRAVILMMRQACVMVHAGGVVGPAEREMTGWLVQGLAVLRLVQLAPYVFVLAARERWGAGGNPTVVIGLYVVEVAWSVGMFSSGLRRGAFTRLQSLASRHVGRPREF